MLTLNQLEKRRQIAGVFIVLGLLIEALCLIWSTPIAFVIFVVIGGLLMFAGIALFLFSLVSSLKAPV
jgi:hypothetical protein